MADEPTPQSPEPPRSVERFSAGLTLALAAILLAVTAHFRLNEVPRYKSMWVALGSDNYSGATAMVVESPVPYLGIVAIAIVVVALALYGSRRRSRVMIALGLALSAAAAIGTPVLLYGALTLPTTNVGQKVADQVKHGPQRP